MKIGQIQDLALKILGIYFLKDATSLVSQVANVASSVWDEWRHGNQGWGFALSGFIAPIISLLFSYILVFRTRGVRRILWPEETEFHETSAFVLTTATCVGLVSFCYSLQEVEYCLWAFEAFFKHSHSILNHDRSLFDKLSTLAAHAVILTVFVTGAVKANTIAVHLNRWAQGVAAGTDRADCVQEKDLQ